jgi:sec-independent protein translocase protein TatA
MPDLGWPELIIIVFVLMLLFGAKKLPDMARGTGRALRIFKAETKGLIRDDDDDEPTATGGGRTAGGMTTETTPTPTPPAQLPQHPVIDAQVVHPVEPLPPTHVEQDR